MSKRNACYHIDEKVLEEFTKLKGCYSKSALVESWIIKFLKNESESLPKQEPKPHEKGELIRGSNSV